MKRRDFLQLGGAAAVTGLGLPAWAQSSSVTTAIYPNTWEEAYRNIVTPALKAKSDVELRMQSLWAVDQIAKARASRGRPPFDTFVLDPGPRVTGIESGLFEKFDGSKLSNASKLQPGMVDEHGVTVAAQFVGIAYNPKKFSKPPTSWKELFAEPYVSRLGLTGFQTTFGTVSIIEMAKVFGGSESNVEPFFTELKKVLPKVAVIGNSASMPSMFQQGQCDIMYANTQTVSTLKAKGVDIEMATPDTGMIAFFTTMHIAKGSKNVEAAYKLIDAVLDAQVQKNLMASPYDFAPVNREVSLAGAGLPLQSLSEMSKMVQHDWSKINPQRPDWIERFNREVAR